MFIRLLLMSSTKKKNYCCCVIILSKKKVVDGITSPETDAKIELIVDEIPTDPPESSGVGVDPGATDSPVPDTPSTVGGKNKKQKKKQTHFFN